MALVLSFTVAVLALIHKSNNFVVLIPVSIVIMESRFTYVFHTELISLNVLRQFLYIMVFLVNICNVIMHCVVIFDK